MIFFLNRAWTLLPSHKRAHAFLSFRFTLNNIALIVTGSKHARRFNREITSTNYTYGRVLDHRSALKPENVEPLICTRDWLFGKKD